jgi:hypothetical protein
VQKRIPGSECLGWSVKRKSVERGKGYDPLTLRRSDAPTLHGRRAKAACQFVRLIPAGCISWSPRTGRAAGAGRPSARPPCGIKPGRRSGRARRSGRGAAWWPGWRWAGRRTGISTGLSSQRVSRNPDTNWHRPHRRRRTRPPLRSLRFLLFWSCAQPAGCRQRTEGSEGNEGSKTRIVPEICDLEVQERFLHRNGGPDRLHALIFSESPVSWRLPK